MPGGAGQNTKTNPGDPTSVLSPSQLKNALTIIAVGKAVGATQSQIISALAVANDESTFENYSNVNEPQSTGKGDPGAVGQDHNSVGVFQQQPHINGSPAWLPYPEAMSVAEQAAAYYGANPKSKNPGVFQVDPKGTMDPGT